MEYSLNRDSINLQIFSTLYLGFLFDEDLSTGGSKVDFYKTLPAIKDFSNLIFNNFNIYTRHFPLHYLTLSLPYFIFDDVYIMRNFYLLFSLTLPIFVYINLCKIYRISKINILIISASLIFESLSFNSSLKLWKSYSKSILYIFVI